MRITNELCGSYRLKYIIIRWKRKNLDEKKVDDPLNLERFIQAQEVIYEEALSELLLGQKRGHWIWYIFPQIIGLGRSVTAIRYSIMSIKEAREYLNHTILGVRLLECTKTLLGLDGITATEIFGFPDDMKLKSSMTLFANVSEPDNVFDLVLDKFFNGRPDEKTLQLLKTL